MNRTLTESMWSAWVGIGTRASWLLAAGPFVTDAAKEEAVETAQRAQQFAQWWSSQHEGF
jgi:hypothetical protein